LINYKVKTLIILPHLDDEFALVPIIKKLNSYSAVNVNFIYCAERNNLTISKKKRRDENIKALELLGCNRKNIIYLNDYFPVDDLKLIQSSYDIYSFIRKFLNKNIYKQIITLNLEGGHPDHDALALIVAKIADQNRSLDAFFIPAYNSRFTCFLPVSVFRPLKKQVHYHIKEIYHIFSWIENLKLAAIYTTERSAFIKLLPFIIYKSFFSKSIYISNKIDIETIDWDLSLSMKRYSVKKGDLIRIIKGL